MITKNTQICVSLSSQPGGFGNLFHNYLYQKLGLDFIYKGCTTKDLRGAIEGIRALGIRGCGVSMPFKVEALKFMDELESKTREIGALNTIVNDQGRLIGFNTDYTAVSEILKSKSVDSSMRTALLGSGGMARATAFALKDTGFKKVTILSRNEATGKNLAAACGFEWASASSSAPYDFLVNTTPMGMKNQELAFGEEKIKNSRYVLDVVVGSGPTPLVSQALPKGIPVISGFEITVLQAQEQFRLYTGVTLSIDQVQGATEFVRECK